MIRRITNIHSVFQLLSALPIYFIYRATGFVKETSLNKPTLLPDENYVFVCNHQSYLDVYVTLMGLSARQIWFATPLRFMTAKQVYYSFLMPLIWLGGGFPTRRLLQKNYSPIKYGIERLNKGERIVIFPEGKRCLPHSTAPHSGVKRIIEGADSMPEIILIHIKWEKDSFFKRRLRLAYCRYDGPINPQQMMDRLYEL